MGSSNEMMSDALSKPFGKPIPRAPKDPPLNPSRATNTP